MREITFFNVPTRCASCLEHLVKTLVKVVSFKLVYREPLLPSFWSQLRISVFKVNKGDDDEEEKEEMEEEEEVYGAGVGNWCCVLPEKTSQSSSCPAHLIVLAGSGQCYSEYGT